MGIHARSGGERLRTVWTAEMDQFFIGLMVAEIRKGNKHDDRFFSRSAWANMASLFNDKFKFQYEKDVLKNRHKTLRNLFRTINNLLSRRGFAWDPIRKMITAENRVWDEYIKAHTEARSFRMKSIPYYDDLCVIYKDVLAETKGENEERSLLSGEKEKTPGRNGAENGKMLALHDVAIDEDYGVAKPENEAELDADVHRAASSGNGVTLGGRSRTFWQPQMDRFFIDMMLDNIRKGSKVDGSFRKKVWAEMIAAFNAKFGFGYDVEVLKNRFKTLKRQVNMIKNLLGSDGFFWDDARQMVVADDSVWQDYIKTHSDARQFMTRPVPYYKDLCKICGVKSNGRECFSGQDSEQQNTEETIGSPTTSVSDGEREGNVIMSKKALGKRRLGYLSLHHKESKKARDENGVASALREMASAVSSLSDKKQNDDNSFSIEGVIEAVQALPDMDEDLILDACDFLEDEKKAKTFMALDSKLRRKWLLRKLRPQKVALSTL